MPRALPGWHGLLLIGVLLILWQLTFKVVGDSAMAPPVATVAYLLQLLAPPPSGPISARRPWRSSWH